MKKSILLFLMTCSFFISQAQVDTILWLVDNLTEIGGNDVQIIGNPTVIQTDIGFAVEFDGIDDGLIVDNNPVAEATAFTIEIIFKAYAGGGVEQRFLHLQQDNDNRILIELRNNNDENWTLDTFIKSGTSSQALLDYSFVHSLDEWHHAALVFKDGAMEHYVDGEKELEGTVDYQVVNSGETSLGVRLNQVSWFKGAIHSVRITHDSLGPEDFMKIDLLSSVENVEEDQSISQIHPNPINSSSLLKYQLTDSSNVSIKILNSKGEEVAKLFEGFKNSGNHELIISRNNLISGTYFIVIGYGDKTDVQKITVTE